MNYAKIIQNACNLNDKCNTMRHNKIRKTSKIPLYQLLCMGYDKMETESNFGLPKRISRGNRSLTEAENRKLEGLREGIRLKSRHLVAE